MAITTLPRVEGGDRSLALLDRSTASRHPGPTRVRAGLSETGSGDLETFWKQAVTTRGKGAQRSTTRNGGISPESAASRNRRKPRTRLRHRLRYELGSPLAYRKRSGTGRLPSATRSY